MPRHFIVNFGYNHKSMKDVTLSFSFLSSILSTDRYTMSNSSFRHRLCCEFDTIVFLRIFISFFSLAEWSNSCVIINEGHFAYSYIILYLILTSIQKQNNILPFLTLLLSCLFIDSSLRKFDVSYPKKISRLVH
jgi:hypothetical protein